MAIGDIRCPLSVGSDHGGVDFEPDVVVEAVILKVLLLLQLKKLDEFHGCGWCGSDERC